MSRALTVLALSLPLAGCLNVDLGQLAARGEWVEQVVFGEEGPKILMIDIDGVINAERGRGPLGFGTRESLIERVRTQLELANEDDDVRALLLRIDSPGGTVTASDILYREIVEFKARRKIPVVAQMMGVAASGAYYVAMAADHVRAHPTTITGSIGVIYSGLNVSGLMDKIGVADQTLTTGPYKDTGSPVRPMRPDERKQLQSVLDDLVARFREVVDEGRPGLDAEAVAKLADGRIYTAGQALEAGLIDAVGYLPEAVSEAERRAGLASSRVVVYTRSTDEKENLYSQAPPAEPRASVIDPTSWLRLPRPAFLYLWWP
jgi:protease-4